MYRDYDNEPYSPGEQRVAQYLSDMTNGIIGGGDDPVGFLIASHSVLTHIVKVRDGCSQVEWINAAKICPPDRTNVLVYGGIAQLHKDTGVWFTQMEQPERPIQWRVTHWAYIPHPSKALIDSVYPPKKVGVK